MSFQFYANRSYKTHWSLKYVNNIRLSLENPTKDCLSHCCRIKISKNCKFEFQKKYWKICIKPNMQSCCMIAKKAIF